jgi:hypothetical protein
VTLGTVSKVAFSLEAELILERKREAGEKGSRRHMRLLQSEKLLNQLAANHDPPKISGKFTGKWRLPMEELEARLKRWESEAKSKVVRTGESSVNAYAVMAREPVESFNVTDLSSLVETLGDNLGASDRFPNLRFLETNDEPLYFDRRDRFQASPIQVDLDRPTAISVSKKPQTRSSGRS